MYLRLCSIVRNWKIVDGKWRIENGRKNHYFPISNFHNHYPISNNQFLGSEKMIKKLIIAFVIYSIVLLLLGRNLAFLPQFDFRSDQKKTQALRKNVIGKFLKTIKGTYSIYYKDLKTGEEFGIDENKVLTAASLTKVLIIAYLYNQANKGKINLEDKIVIQKDDIQDYGTGSIRYEGEGKAYSLKQLIKLALEQSDNTAAHVLVLKLGEDKIQKFGEKLGFSATKMKENKTSAQEMGRLFELIYLRKITSEPLTREFLDFMKDTDFEDRLARDLPSNVAMYHKAADATNMVHDAGIIDPGSTGVDDGKNPFILSILTENIASEEEAKKNIGKLAKFIYDQRN
ncbi:MAG: Beta-lactamase class A-like protein [Candidatus Levybacteria bacterium GW2011_GWA2_40_16]|nr:MAG: Beta-lactamase class A-like protein [Candidatus Levybacteria bacterium GW2011_GWA2_40_16]